jgi:hypothetical protein
MLILALVIEQKVVLGRNLESTKLGTKATEPSE